MGFEGGKIQILCFCLNPALVLFVLHSALAAVLGPHPGWSPLTPSIMPGQAKVLLRRGITFVCIVCVTYHIR